jgi:hypothetical protein
VRETHRSAARALPEAAAANRLFARIPQHDDEPTVVVAIQRALR